MRRRLKVHGNTRATVAGDYPNGTTLTIDGVQHHCQNGYFGGNGKTYAYQRDTVKKVDRFETRDGDEWPGDAGRDNARSELTPDSGSAAIGTAYWVAYDVLIEGPDGSGGGVFGQLHKLHSDATPSSPIISFELASPSGSAPGQIRLKYSYSTDDLDAPSPVINNLTAYSGNTPAYGKWQRLVIKYLQTAIVTGGSLEVWLNGEKIVDLIDIPFGYLDAGAPYWKRGIYRSQSPQKIIATYSNWVGPTTTSQLSRVTTPLAVPFVALTPAALTITTTTLAAPLPNVPYVASLEAAGGAGERVWDIASGAPPDGIFLNPDGTFGGMTQLTGTFTFVGQVTDDSGHVGKSFTVVIPIGFSITTDTLPIFYAGTAAAAPISTVGAAGPVTLTVPAGSLPSAFTLSDAGLSVSAGATPGNFSFPVTATSNGVSVSKTLSATVVAAMAFDQASLPVPQVQRVYNTPVTVQGGVAPVVVALTSGSIPGLTFANGSYDGTPTTAGTYPLTFTATDANGAIKTVNYSVVIASALTVVNTGLGAIQQGVDFSQQLTSNGGSGSKTWAKTGGSAFFAISTSGGVTATTQTAGAYTLTGTVTDSNGSTPFSFSGTVAAAPAQTYDNNWADGIGVVGTANVAAWDTWVTNTKSGVLVTLPWDQAFTAVKTAWDTAVTAMKTRNGRVEFEVPLASFNGIGGFTLAAVGSGTFDALWTAMIDNAIANGLGHAGLVLGPRFNNQTQYVPWGCMDQTAAYITAFNRFASIAKARPGASFRIVWAPSTGFHSATATPSVMFDPANAYPGDPNVTDIGLMIRAQEWDPARSTTLPWQTIKDGPSGNGLACLSWQYTFAKNHAKAICYPAYNLSTTFSDGSGYPDSVGAPLTGQFIDYVNASPDDVQVTGGNWEQLTGGILGDDSRPLTETEFSEAAGFVDRTALRITNSAPPSGTVGGAYSYTYVVDGGVAPYSYGHTGNYPTGTSRTNATVSGTLTAGGSYTSTFTVTDSSVPAQSVSKTYTIQIAAAASNYFAQQFGLYPDGSGSGAVSNLNNVFDPGLGFRSKWVSVNVEGSTYSQEIGNFDGTMSPYVGANVRNMSVGVELATNGYSYTQITTASTQPYTDFGTFITNWIAVLNKYHNLNPTQEISIRPEHERNGVWYGRGNYGPNYAGAGNSGPAFKAAFRRFALAVKAACPWVKLDWSLAAGLYGMTMAQLVSYYPGDDAVDIISVDNYNEASSPTVPAAGSAMFDEWMGNGTNDSQISFWYNFARATSGAIVSGSGKAQAKLFAVGETGTGVKQPGSTSVNGYSRGDDSGWMSACIAWWNGTVQAGGHRFIYFDINGTGNYDTTLFPANFGGTAKPNTKAVIIAALAA